jgi:transporter family protein
MPTWFTYALFSALFSAFAAILQKVVLKKIDAISFTFIITVINVVFISVYICFVGFPELSNKEILILLIKTILGAFAFLFVMLSIENFELSSVLPILAFTPAFVALFAFILLGEAISYIKLIGMFVMLIGIYIVENSDHHLLQPLKYLFGKSKSRYILFALLLFTISSVLDKLLIGTYKINPTDFIVLQQLLALPVFALIFLFYSKKKSIKLFRSKELILMLLIISVLTLLYRFLYVKSLQFGAVALALTVKRFSVVIAVALSGKLLKEQNIRRKVVAALLIIAGSFLLLKN